MAGMLFDCATIYYIILYLCQNIKLYTLNIYNFSANYTSLILEDFILSYLTAGLGYIQKYMD